MLQYNLTNEAFLATMNHEQVLLDFADEIAKFADHTKKNGGQVGYLRTDYSNGVLKVYGKEKLIIRIFSTDPKCEFTQDQCMGIFFTILASTIQ